MAKRGRDDSDDDDNERYRRDVNGFSSSTHRSEASPRRGTKRMRLEDLFDSLSIDESDDHEYDIPDYLASSAFDNYIQNRINKEYTEEIEKSYQLIKWFNPRVLLIYRWQMWMVRLFNRFIQKFNEKNGTRLPRIKRYDKIIRLVANGQLTRDELVNIIAQETNLELIDIRRRRLRRQRKDEKAKIQEFKDLSYNYWDNLGIDRDIEMSSESSY
ncbi:hypothetical protein DIURU_001285 [Diutina rugosa]|uniref:Uncharacterized protein n=1 Tax=Diutina rugosa TaxID=5481 RepID=A0A642UZL0_DIURU|nr:uncharacterized protein DIURU_001285 [Diutina rugosa]KAA8905908.1 hypothetical protein DIURU_001285 [Diutina rugosa]